MKYLLYIFLLSFNALSLEIATFAGGCFWCVEADLEKIPGVREVISGYSGGKKISPSYQEVSSGKTEHLEAVQVRFDSGVISFRDLLIEFFSIIDPTDSSGQFVDRGVHYSTAIFFHNANQKKTAGDVKKLIESKKIFKKTIITPIIKYKNFYRAETYHQDFYKKNKKSIKRYKAYRKHSGRDEFIKKYWKKHKANLLGSHGIKLSKKELKNKLTRMQFYVTQENGTEPPFKNKYYKNTREGIYVDIVSGEALFSSKDKFKSGTGWPSFTKPIDKDHIVEKDDSSLFMKRVEVRSRYSDSHLGHVFTDGPKPTGLRYCINSASLRFIPKDELKGSRYEIYLRDF